MSHFKLFYFLLGSSPEGRLIEQHDIFFCIAQELKDCLHPIKNFWPGKHKVHIDCWREVTTVDGRSIEILPKTAATETDQNLYFINLGGYIPGLFDETHHRMLCVAKNLSEAIALSKKTTFYKTNSTPQRGGNSHVDDKYGVDVDDAIAVVDVLSSEEREKFSISISDKLHPSEDVVHIGYVPLSRLGG